MIRLLLGIQPTTPGWRTFEFVPQPASLAAINATVPAGSGNVIVVTIRQTTGSFATTLDVPIGSTSELFLNMCSNSITPPCH
jgi:alpha-L-rhamnosidase